MDKEKETKVEAEVKEEPVKEEPKKPEKPKPMKKPEKPEFKIDYPTPAEKIKECLDQLSEANRERVQPLTETEAAIAIRLNNPYRLKQNRVSLHDSFLERLGSRDLECHLR